MDKNKLGGLSYDSRSESLFGCREAKCRLSLYCYCGNLQNSKDGVADLIEAYGTTEQAKKLFKLVLVGKSLPRGNKSMRI